MAVRGEAPLAALRVEVPLIPESGLPGRAAGIRRGHGVLDRIATDGYLSADPVRVKDRGDARRSIAPVEAGEGEIVQPQRVGEIDHVLGDRRLLCRSRRRRITEARGSVAA